MNSQMKLKILLLICASGLVVSLAYITHILQTSGKMIFPKPAKGIFIQKPGIVVDEKIPKITWVIPEKCDFNSYEIREASYAPNAGMLWGGGDASCAQTKAGSECQAELHPEIKKDGRDWIIQAYGYGCANDNFYISKPVTVTF